MMLESIRELYIFSNKFKLFEDTKRGTALMKAGPRELTQQNMKILDILKKRCTILVMVEDQVDMRYSSVLAPA
jgi:hypothetical protein